MYKVALTFHFRSSASLVKQKEKEDIIKEKENDEFLKNE